MHVTPSVIILQTTVSKRRGVRGEENVCYSDRWDIGQGRKIGIIGGRKCEQVKRWVLNIALLKLIHEGLCNCIAHGTSVENIN